VTAEGIVDLKAAYNEGVRTIVDVTTFDLGRDIGLLEEVSAGVVFISSPAPATTWQSLETLPHPRPQPSPFISSGRFRRAVGSRRALSKLPATGEASPQPKSVGDRGFLAAFASRFILRAND